MRYTAIIKDAVINVGKTWIPPRVLNVWYIIDNKVESMEINTQGNADGFVQLYKGASHGWRWHTAFMSTLFAPMQAFYLLETWSSEQKAFNYHYLSARVLSNVLQLQGLTSWWAMCDFGICTLIASYFIANRPHTMRVFAIVIGDTDVTSTLKPFMSSIVLDRNLTAYALCKLYAHLIGEDGKKYEENCVTLVDFDLEERVVTGDEYLFP